ncbi:DUF4389 domain-containing protein [Pseudomonas sp. SST3]|uniref:DUF4389 domain-containing protein n=1 Tax=Pseudomonas sp. SST3 TaxID=2267882 RepID=UPI000E0320FF|nr:DUF4389 domain-containing protein [Pseudomonas sp. SST3]NKQ10715.1 DUF4389 domain-containing protein [Pseudomonas sp. SST3]
MSTSQRSADRESLILRAIWMLVFFFVWQVAELVLLVVVVAQLVLHAVNGKANESLQGLGDSLSQYVAQIGRFGTFNTDRKPWPMSDWPKPRPADRETSPPVTPVSPEQEPQP